MYEDDAQQFEVNRDATLVKSLYSSKGDLGQHMAGSEKEGSVDGFLLPLILDIVDDYIATGILNGESSLNITDVGGGIGDLLALVSDHIFEKLELPVQANNVDLTEDNLLRSQNRFKGIDVIEGSAQRIPLASNSQHLAMMNYVIRHINLVPESIGKASEGVSEKYLAKKIAVEEALRIIKPGGKLIVTFSTEEPDQQINTFASFMGIMGSYYDVYRKNNNPLKALQLSISGILSVINSNSQGFLAGLQKAKPELIAAGHYNGVELVDNLVKDLNLEVHTRVNSVGFLIATFTKPQLEG